MLRKKQHKETSTQDQRQLKNMQAASSSPINFWRKWLLVASIIQAVVSLAMMLLQDFLDEFLWNPLFFYDSKLDQTFSPEVKHYIHFLFGVMGAVMVGWSILLFFYIKSSFASGDRQVWYALVLSVGGWYVLDSVFSIAMGFWTNAVLNTAFALIFFIPFIASSKYFRKIYVPYV
jgi:hypothetical protein